MCNKTGLMRLVSNTLSYFRGQDLCFGSATILQFIYMFIFLLDFCSTFFLKMLACNSCMEGTEGKDRVWFFSFVSVSAGIREKGGYKLRGESILPPPGVWSRKLFFPLCSNLGGICVLFVDAIPLARAFSAVGGRRSPRVTSGMLCKPLHHPNSTTHVPDRGTSHLPWATRLHLKSNKYLCRQIQHREWMNMGMPVRKLCAVLWARKHLCVT